MTTPTYPFVANALYQPSYKSGNCARKVIGRDDTGVTDCSGTQYAPDAPGFENQMFSSVKGHSNKCGEGGNTCGNNSDDDWTCYKPIWSLCTNNSWYGGDRFNACDWSDNFPTTVLDKALITDGSDERFANIADYSDVLPKPGWMNLNSDGKYYCQINANDEFDYDKNFAGIDGKGYMGLPSCPLQCVFDPEKFDSMEMIEAYAQKWGTWKEDGQDHNWDLILSNFCARPQRSEFCPDDPLTGKPMEPHCSTFLSKTDEGDMCRQWVNSKGNIYQRYRDPNVEKSYLKYCSTTDDSTNQVGPDCACINRDDDPLYTAGVAGGQALSVSDGCWWKPCADNMHYLISRDIYNSDGYLNCANMGCTQFISSVNVADYNSSDVETKMTCCFGENCGNADTSGSGGTPGEPFSNPRNIGILVGVIAAALIIISAVLFVYFYRKSAPTRQPNAPSPGPNPNPNPGVSPNLPTNNV